MHYFGLLTYYVYPVGLEFRVLLKMRSTDEATTENHILMKDHYTPLECNARPSHSI